MLQNNFSHQFSERDWSAAKEEARAAMIEKAKVRSTLSYSDLVSYIHTINLEAHDPRLFQMLCDIGSEEEASGRGILTAVVVHKQGDLQPGQGFYELAQKLGRKGSKDEIWINELSSVHNYWSNA